LQPTPRACVFRCAVGALRNESHHAPIIASHIATREIEWRARAAESTLSARVMVHCGSARARLRSRAQRGDDIELESTFVQAQHENSWGMLETECPDALASALAPENK
jgi:hypothetical protein